MSNPTINGPSDAGYALFPSRTRTIGAVIASLLALGALLAYVSAPVGAKPHIEGDYHKSKATLIKGTVEGHDLDRTRVRVVFFDDGERIKSRRVKLRDDGSFKLRVPNGADRVRIVVISPAGKVVRNFSIRPDQMLRLRVTAGGANAGLIPLPIPY